MADHPTIERGTIRLRPFQPSDWPGIIEAAADPYIVAVTTVPAPGDESAARAFIHRQHERLSSGAGYSFAIAAAATDSLVGHVGVWLRDRDRGRATLGYWVIPSARGTGIATLALTTATEFAWTLSDLVRLELHIEPGNTASIRTAEHCGYLREGLLRSYQLINNEWRDMLCYASIRRYSAVASPTGQDTPVPPRPQ